MTTPQDPDAPRPPGEGETPPPPPPPGQGQTPPPAYGQGYGQPGQGYGEPAPGYGQAPPPAYGGYGAPGGEVQPAGGAFADWPLRAQSALVDWFGPSLLVSLLNLGGLNRTLVSLLGLVALGWALYNAYLGGSTGQSYGKKWARTRLVRATDGQLLGGGMGIVRYILHIVDALPCYLGFLWPLWDQKRQTFADKIVSTYVVRV